MSDLPCSLFNLSIEVGFEVSHTHQTKRPHSLSKMFKKPTQLTESSTGVPTFMGLSGNKLVAAITTTATIGFLLFGYGGVAAVYVTPR